MTKYEKWKDLIQQTRLARKEKNEKRNALTSCNWSSVENKESCIRYVQVQSLTTDDNNLQFQYTEHRCEKFSDKHTCIDYNCPLREKNAEYVLANLKYKALKADRKRAFWKMFQRSI